MDTESDESIESTGLIGRTIQFPPKQRGGSIVEIKHEGVIVCIGANGSGKSRLGEWLDTSYPDTAILGRVFRISAQKSLRFPKYLSTSSEEAAREALLYGYALQPHQRGGKMMSRYP